MRSRFSFAPLQDAFRLRFSIHCTCGTMTAKGDPVKILLPFAVAILLFGAASARAQSSSSQKEKTDTAPAGNVEAGKKIFTKDGCYECHGHEGQGAAQGAGPRIGPPLLSQEGFMKYVRQPAGQMPPYTSKVISDQELTDIFAYLQSRPKGTPSKDIPLLN